MLPCLTTCQGLFLAFSETAADNLKYRTQLKLELDTLRVEVGCLRLGCMPCLHLVPLPKN